ncbi:manganese catalase family protein [Thermoanaerobacterium thermosaccharolyticum]|jgi:spore coat protein JC|uniref:Manganese containing catalase n=3 Tax=Thermoanaerobacterium thermosaccharolyticum TaxID=1517 RepID=D9TM16_THETC|nr:manganese catalase family protein [Thermoanaerobacterium thermosaccharolyticum]ADL68396.1 manganese containing catalase [Thermoanaerobacterium thermosaccharolyticum DSM 571]AGB18476.1 Mn-containing catalase [Thermoanaerobacterium thermosaccharolyticum M0795]AST58467.1 manganese containing catalase [Thermoanaerobacterium thermosaccharolyticum]KAA5808275.1 manganese catalase family protein [Thermoanaerobacterium thermosaccharolyticum]MCP2239557.1 spore coat protein JC [Thermoanaerobacterium t
MWVYEKKLEYPANVCKPDIKMAKFLIAQYGGPDGELAAALRYQTQRYTMPTGQAKGTLTDISTEEFAHLEIIATMVFKLLKGVPAEELRREGLGEQYTEHDRAIFYNDATGMLWTAAYIQAKGDVIADLHEDMAAEEKARATYEHLINLTDDPCVKDTLRFLREREIVHFQRFGETLDRVREHLRCKKIY